MTDFLEYLTTQPANNTAVDKESNTVADEQTADSAVAGKRAQGNIISGKQTNLERAALTKKDIAVLAKDTVVPSEHTELQQEATALPNNIPSPKHREENDTNAKANMDAQATTETAAKNAMIKARSMLVLDHPFFGSLALRLSLQEDAHCADLWTDGKTLAYNPAYVNALSNAALIGAQAHEIMHLACGHHLRRGGRDKTMWNEACDHAVNLILKDAGFKLPTGFICDEAYAEQSVESIYDTLMRMQERDPNEGATNALEKAPGSADATGGSPGQHDGTETSDTSKERSKKSDANQGDGENEQQAGAAGNRATQGKTGKKKDAATFTGEVRDHPGLGAEQEAVSRAHKESDIALSQALHRAGHMGDVPAGLLRLVRRRLVPRLDWQSVLRRFLETCSGGDYSWTTPNRRYLDQGFYLPSMYVPQIPELVLAVDASGSIDDEVLAMFCTELSSILEAYDTRITVLYHDTVV